MSLYHSSMCMFGIDLTVIKLHRHPGELEKDEGRGKCEYTVEGLDFSHTGVMRVNRMQMIENLRWAFPDVVFMHRYSAFSLLTTPMLQLYSRPASAPRRLANPVN